MSGELQQTSDRRLVDEIVYMASLASEAQAIEPKLNVLRRVTARWDGSSPLTPDSREDLTALSSDLRAYLINNDPLRSFTAQTLDERLERHVREGADPESYILPLGVAEMLVAAIVALPLPMQTLAERMLIFVTITMQLFIASALWFYLTSLKSFKTELRTVFIVLCVGIASINLGILQYPLLAILQQADNPIFRYGGRPEFATIGVIILYFGLARYARILKIPTKSITRGMILAHLILIPTAYVLAVTRGVPDPYILWLSFVSIWSLALSSTASIILIPKILRTVTVAYAMSLKIINVFMWLAMPVAIMFGAGLLWLGHYSITVLATSLTYAGFPTLATLMYSGYSFKRETGK